MSVQETGSPCKTSGISKNQRWKIQQSTGNNNSTEMIKHAAGTKRQGIPKVWSHNFQCDQHLKKKDTWDMWRFPKMGVPKNGWFIREKSVEMDDLGVPLSQEASISKTHQPNTPNPTPGPVSGVPTAPLSGKCFSLCLNEKQRIGSGQFLFLIRN